MERQIERICISRPAVEACGEKIGFIPGGISEKMHPFLVPIYDNLKSYAQENYEQVMEVTEIVPLAYMRGRTLRNACVILDEAQNASFEQMKMFLTRIGKGSHMIICGDESQSDIRLCVLTSIAERLSQAVPSIYHHRFQTTSAAIRHPIIPLITRSLESAPC